MGSSMLQAFLVSEIILLLGKKIDSRKYVIMTNEIGLSYSKGHWRNADIVIFEKSKIKDEIFSTEYAKTPPEIVIEVDTKADLKQFTSEMDYFYEKTDNLLDWGVKKVIWIFTKAKKVMTAQKGENWLTSNWDKDIIVIDDVILNIGALMGMVKD